MGLLDFDINIGLLIEEAVKTKGNVLNKFCGFLDSKLNEIEYNENSTYYVWGKYQYEGRELYRCIYLIEDTYRYDHIRQFKSAINYCRYVSVSKGDLEVRITTFNELFNKDPNRDYWWD